MGWVVAWGGGDLRDIRRGTIGDRGVAICQLATGVTCKKNVGGK